MYAVVAIAVVALIFYCIGGSLENAPSLQITQLTSLAVEEWMPILHRRHNAFLLWRDSPFFTFFTGLFESDPTKGLATLYRLQIAVFFLGLWSLLVQERRAVGASMTAAGLTLIFVLLFGVDQVLMGACVWVPSLLSLLWWEKFRLPEYRISYYFFLTLMSLLVAFSANHLGLFVVCACFLSACLFRKRIPLPSFALCFTILLVYQTCAVPKMELPDYPKLSRVVADDGLGGVIYSNLGQSSPIQIIDLFSVKESFLGFSLFLTLVSISLFLGFYWQNRDLKNYFFLATIFSMAGLLDCVSYENIRVLMPLAVLSRNLPNCFLFPILPVSLVFAKIWVALGVWKYYRPSLVSWWYVSMALLFYIVLPENFRVGVLQTTFDDKMAAFMQVAGPLERSKMPLKVMVSPSYHILRTEGPHVLEGAKIVPHLTFSPINDVLAEVRSTHNANKISLAVDGNPLTKWDTGYPGQLGFEEVSLRFKETIEFDAFELDLDGFRTDFPRGLAVSVSETCEEFGEVSDLIYDAPIWQGRVHLSKKGFPYYGSQSDVKVILDRPYSAKCLYFKQTANTPVFTWSIAEIKLHRTK